MKTTIIIPFYNREQYLYETLLSVESQSYKDFQVILIDDCSSDSSFDIAKSFVDRNHHFMIIKNKIKQRQGKAKNQGIKYVLGILNKDMENIEIFGTLKSSSDYIFFLDSDDLLAPDALANLIDIATRKKADLTIGSTKIFGEYEKNIIYDDGFRDKSEILDKPRYFSFGWGGVDRYKII